MSENTDAPTAILVPFITWFGERRYQFEVLVAAEESALRGDSITLRSQIRTISIEHRLTEPLGSIPQERTNEDDAALWESLGLTEL